MTDKRTDIINAAMRVFMRYGMRRSTMGDIATEAEVSRPTLYGQFKNKDDVIHAAIMLQNENIIAKIKVEWDGAATLSDKLEIYFQHAVVYFYDLFQRWPDATDLTETPAPSTRDALAKCYDNYDDLLEQLFAPFQSDLAQPARDLAMFVRITSASFKTTAISRTDLDTMLNMLRTMTLAVLPNAA